jgi:polysaccharide export outer membrane protein
VWRVEEGDVIKARVYREPDLSSEPTVAANGTAYFPGIGRIAVGGLTIDSLEALLNAKYETVVRSPAVQVTMQRDITLYGQVRIPGVYPVDPGMTMMGLLAKAGGQSGQGGTPEVTLQTSDGRRLLLPAEARLGNLDIHRRDAVYLAEQSFFLRNSASITATSLVVSTLSTLIGLVLVVSR